MFNFKKMINLSEMAMKMVLIIILILSDPSLMISKKHHLA